MRTRTASPGHSRANGRTAVCPGQQRVRCARTAPRTAPGSPVHRTDPHRTDPHGSPDPHRTVVPAPQTLTRTAPQTRTAAPSRASRRGWPPGPTGRRSTPSRPGGGRGGHSGTVRRATGTVRPRRRRPPPAVPCRSHRSPRSDRVAGTRLTRLGPTGVSHPGLPGTTGVASTRLTRLGLTGVSHPGLTGTTGVASTRLPRQPWLGPTGVSSPRLPRRDRLGLAGVGRSGLARLRPARLWGHPPRACGWSTCPPAPADPPSRRRALGCPASNGSAGRWPNRHRHPGAHPAPPPRYPGPAAPGAPSGGPAARREQERGRACGPGYRRGRRHRWPAPSTMPTHLPGRTPENPLSPSRAGKRPHPIRLTPVRRRSVRTRPERNWPRRRTHARRWPRHPPEKGRRRRPAGWTRALRP